MTDRNRHVSRVGNIEKETNFLCNVSGLSSARYFPPPGLALFCSKCHPEIFYSSILLPPKEDFTGHTSDTVLTVVLCLF